MGNFVKNVAPLGFNNTARARDGGTFNKETGVWTFTPQTGGTMDVAFTNADMFSVNVKVTYANKAKADTDLAAGIIPVVRIISGSAQLSRQDRMMWQTGGKPGNSNGSNGFGDKIYYDLPGTDYVMEYSIPVMVGVYSPNYIVVACAENTAGWENITSLEVVAYEITGME
jgi:hypothetical protein